MLLRFTFIALITSARDASIGVTSFGSVKMPAKPIVETYPLDQQQKTFNILVPTIVVGSSPRKIHEELAYEFSTFKWPDSGRNMFNVTLLTSEDN